MGQTGKEMGCFFFVRVLALRGGGGVLVVVSKRFGEVKKGVCVLVVLGH